MSSNDISQIRGPDWPSLPTTNSLIDLPGYSTRLMLMLIFFRMILPSLSFLCFVRKMTSATTSSTIAAYNTDEHLHRDSRSAAGRRLREYDEVVREEADNVGNDHVVVEDQLSADGFNSGAVGRENVSFRERRNLRDALCDNERERQNI